MLDNREKGYILAINAIVRRWIARMGEREKVPKGAFSFWKEYFPISFNNIIIKLPVILFVKYG